MEGLGVLKLFSSDKDNGARIDVFRVKSLHLITHNESCYKLVALDVDGNNFVLKNCEDIVEGDRDLSNLWSMLRDSDSDNMYVKFIKNEGVTDNISAERTYLKQKDFEYRNNKKGNILGKTKTFIE